MKVAVEKNLVYFVGDSGGGGGGRGLNVLHTGLHALQKRRANPQLWGEPEARTVLLPLLKQK